MYFFLKFWKWLWVSLDMYFLTTPLPRPFFIYNCDVILIIFFNNYIRPDKNEVITTYCRRFENFDSITFLPINILNTFCVLFHTDNEFCVRRRHYRECPAWPIVDHAICWNHGVLPEQQRVDVGLFGYEAGVQKVGIVQTNYTRPTWCQWEGFLSFKVNGKKMYRVFHGFFVN